MSNIFGHIANYDETGFWEVWFATPAKQRQFIRRIHEWVPMGDPNFCWSDVEREMKSWAATNAEAIDAVLTENERKFAEAMKAETDRRAALQSKTHQTVHGRGEKHQFRRVRAQAIYYVSPTTAARGKSIAFTSIRGQVGQVVSVPLTHGEPDWCSIQGVECPERIQNCPHPVEA